MSDNIYDKLDKLCDTKPKQAVSVLVEYLTGDKYWTTQNISDYDLMSLRELIEYFDKNNK
jgi:hypothetical protein